MTHLQTITVAKWIKATTLGWLLGIVAILILSAIIESLGASEFQFFMGLGMGAGIGVAQWRILKPALNISKKWIWFTIIGIGAPFLLFDILKIFAAIDFGQYYILYCIVLAGALSGILQSRLLRPHFAKTNLWIICTFLGWLLATLAFLCINYTNRLLSGNWPIFAANVFLILIGGVILGTLTGLCLQYAMRSKNTAQLNTTN